MDAFDQWQEWANKSPESMLTGCEGPIMTIAAPEITISRLGEIRNPRKSAKWVLFERIDHSGIGHD